MKLIYQDKTEIGYCGYSMDGLENYSDASGYNDYDNNELNIPCQALSLRGLEKVERIDWSDDEDSVNLSLTFNDGDHFIVPCKKVKVDKILRVLNNKEKIKTKGILKCF